MLSDREMLIYLVIKNFNHICTLADLMPKEFFSSHPYGGVDI